MCESALSARAILRERVRALRVHAGCPLALRPVCDGRREPRVGSPARACGHPLADGPAACGAGRLGLVGVLADDVAPKAAGGVVREPEDGVHIQPHHLVAATHRMSPSSR